MVDAVADEIVLYRRGRPWVIIAIACSILLVGLLQVMLLDAFDETGGLIQRILRAPAYQIVPLVITGIAFVIVAVSQTIIHWKSRLVIDASGIRHQSPQPSWLKGLYSSWTMNWADVRAIRVAPSIFDTIPGSTLTIDGVSQRRKLSVYEWVDAKHRGQRLDKALRARRRIKPQVLTRVLEQQSLMKVFRARGLQVDVQVGVAAPPSRGFDLGSNRHAMFSLLLLAALAAYAAIEIILPGQPMSWNMPLLVGYAASV